ncbi:hypothetical protein D8674_040793 [Pyrus ussuriensis x Pyrus communis]|uniref:Uncharacterized protein n=1 Tax=Pyrus ussuriensis x Pyrus communis TaxID=2448454 RepID=A0A5N5I3U5_9ROSA|nr:hypothetical protein D8674_040793 [Pyrus ussuriensis x Pyrus communis]
MPLPMHPREFEERMGEWEWLCGHFQSMAFLCYKELCGLGESWVLDLEEPSSSSYHPLSGRSSKLQQMERKLGANEKKLLVSERKSFDDILLGYPKQCQLLVLHSRSSEQPLGVIPPTT